MIRFVKKIAFPILLAATFVSGADLLRDDFTDPVASHLRWGTFPTVDGINRTVNGGSCIINNTSPHGGGSFHAFNAPKPTTFTFSFVLKSQPRQGVGAMFCKQSGNSYNGYYITTNNDSIAVFKYVYNSDSARYQGRTVFYQKSWDINSAGNNKFTISKSGSKFHVSVNDIFQGEFIDSEYSTGDIVLFVEAGLSAEFGTVYVTDQFTEGQPRTSFSDNFNGNGLRYWNFLRSGSGAAPIIEEKSGALSMKTETNMFSWMYVDMNLTDFSSRVVVRHTGNPSSNQSAYGIVLIGEPLPGGNIPMVNFGVYGNRHYAVWKTGEADTMRTSNNVVKGSPGDMAIALFDTLEVKKTPGSSNYEFIVNGTTLSNNYPVVNFKIIGIGIFCYQNLNIEFSNFFAEQYGSTSVTWRTSPRGTQGNRQLIKNNNPVSYDLMGRKRISPITASGSGRAAQTRAAGVYVNENGRDIRVRKR